MRGQVSSALALALCVSGSAFAHRLDEYLQATILSVAKNHVEGSMRLVPGVAVADSVLRQIDANRDATISREEQITYARRVLREVSLRAGGKPLSLHLVSFYFPDNERIRAGIGQIELEFSADLPQGETTMRQLSFENRHLSGISVYLMNCLAPRDLAIRIVSQSRNHSQSLYRLEYLVGAPAPAKSSAQSVGFASIYRLGMRHIAEGTDHLLFLLALLLPAPLIATARRWSKPSSIRDSVAGILKLVTAFTIGHSITLALAGFGLVHVPARPVEVLIAISILVSALHALRPLFPGREAQLAGFFGLVHGLAFAATITDLGLGAWERAASVLAFNLGIETMQLLVVAAVMPSLLLLRGTRMYSLFRVGGALFAAAAATGWVIERIAGRESAVDRIVEQSAHFAPWLCLLLSTAAAVSWAHRRHFTNARENAALPRRGYGYTAPPVQSP